MSYDITGITIAEGIIVDSFNYNGNFLSRDEEGDLWVTEDKPTVHKDESGDYLGFEKVKNFDGMHSLSVFNHMFNFIGKLDVVELEKDLLSQIRKFPNGVKINAEGTTIRSEKVTLDGSTEIE